MFGQNNHLLILIVGLFMGPQFRLVLSRHETFSFPLSQGPVGHGGNVNRELSYKFPRVSVRQ
ncbi:hypothetical protein BDZ94DRAFT_1245699 [Collybia nuda]|uniref:Secreted protein n=1 Tax=Collybia nuda TaxID=64659 RepID=A0A9P6CJA5_9AGAR|nr:hypothetical protein BDZ94DRAFT_1245699 [Collybia nuda]